MYVDARVYVIEREVRTCAPHVVALLRMVYTRLLNGLHTFSHVKSPKMAATMNTLLTGLVVIGCDGRQKMTVQSVKMNLIEKTKAMAKLKRCLNRSSFLCGRRSLSFLVSFFYILFVS